jgi:hypothetical protein
LGIVVRSDAVVNWWVEGGFIDLVLFWLIGEMVVKYRDARDLDLVMMRGLVAG